jgi:hypothetical protein
MDVVVPFYTISGLDIADQMVFRDDLRTLILDRRNAFPHIDPAVLLLPRETLLAAVSSRWGEEARIRVERWGDCVFEVSVQEHLNLYYWKRVLQHCRRNVAAWASLQIPVALDSLLVSQFERSTEMKKYYNIHKDVYERSLSDWDLHAYALYQFNDNDTYPTSGPAKYFYPTVQAYQGYRFWSWALNELSREAQELIYQNALRIVEGTRQLAFVRELPPPWSLELKL